VKLGVVALAACSHLASPALPNEAVQKAGRKVVWRGKIDKATLTRGAPVVVRFADKIELTIPSCYPHAASKVGDHDHIQVQRLDTHATATAGELDIADCTTHHLTATLWASWPDNTRVEAQIDTALVEP